MTRPPTLDYASDDESRDDASDGSRRYYRDPPSIEMMLCLAIGEAILVIVAIAYSLHAIFRWY